jgi:peptide/nickel transport system substrate-binding protein
MGIRYFLILALVTTMGCEFRVLRDPNIIVRYFGSDPSSLNPITATDAYEKSANGLVTETLLERNNATLELSPVLAVAWEESADHLRYRFQLRKNVQWHDGHPFTAADVVYSFETINDPEVGAGHLRSYFQKAGIAKVEAIDDHTIEFQMDRPYVFALETMGWMPIVPKHIFDDGTPFRKNPAGRTPIGTGPMKFSEWKTGRFLKLVRFEGYWGEQTAFSGMTFKIIPDQGVAFHAVKKGLIDFSGVRPIQWARQIDTPRFLDRYIKIKFLPDTAAYGYIGWNQRNTILQDKRVRQALTMLTPRKKMLEALIFNQGRIVTGPVYPLGPQYDHSLKPWPYDPTRADAALDAAGWTTRNADGVRTKDGKAFTIKIIYPGPSRFYDALANILREDLRKAGIDASVQHMEWTVFLKTINDKKYDAYFGAWSGGGVETDPFQLWHSSQIEQGSNYVQFENNEVDTILETARQEFDPQKRNAMYKRFHQIISDEQPYTFLYRFEALAVRHHRFTNVELYSNGPDMREWGVGQSEVLIQ